MKVEHKQTVDESKKGEFVVFPEKNHTEEVKRAEHQNTVRTYLKRMRLRTVNAATAPETKRNESTASEEFRSIGASHLDFASSGRNVVMLSMYDNVNIHE